MTPTSKLIEKIGPDNLKKILLMVLTVFFGMQLLSRIFIGIGDMGRFPGLITLSKYCFPFVPEPYVKNGVALLASKDNPVDNKVVDRSISNFRQSINTNILFVHSHFNLGRAYLWDHQQVQKNISKGIDSLRRSMILQNGQNIKLRTESIKLMLEYWEKLSDTNRNLTKNHLSKIFPSLDENGIREIIEKWSSYCQEISLFFQALEISPQYNNLLAEALVPLEKRIDMRHLLKLNHEIYTLNDIELRYDLLVKEANLSLDTLKDLRQELFDNIKGYYGLIQGGTFNVEKYRGLVKRLDLHILYLYLARGSWHLGGKHREEVTAFINLCIDDLHTKYDLEDLEKFLDKNKYFNTRAPASFYIKGRLHNKMGEQTKFLDEIGDISNFISANSQAKRNQITAVILQVAEAYISSRLLVKAKDVLLEAETLSKNQIEVYQIKMYIEKILGASKNVDEQSKKYYDIILNSNEFKLESQIMEKKIFLVRDKIVKINIPEEFDKKISSKHIMQVFVDGDIRFESYVSKLSRTIIVNVPKPRSFSPHIINIKIL